MRGLVHLLRYRLDERQRLLQQRPLGMVLGRMLQDGLQDQEVPWDSLSSQTISVLVGTHGRLRQRPGSA